MQDSPSQQKNDLSPNINNANMEKPGVEQLAITLQIPNVIYSYRKTTYAYTVCQVLFYTQ